MITEKKLWEMVSLSIDGFPRNAFDSPLMVRLCNIFKIIKSARQQVGVTRYEVPIKFIRDELAICGDEIDESTVYRYVRKAVSSGLLVIETKTIESYQKMVPVPASPGEIPHVHLLDVDGVEIPPSMLNGMAICAEVGEISIKSYKPSDKGERLLKAYEGWRDGE